MIELPEGVHPNGVAVSIVDFDGVLRPFLGGRITKVTRLGDRFKIGVSLPPLPNAEIGALVISRLIRAKKEGGRIEYPLAGVDQGIPGAVLVDGANQSGTTINLRNATPHYAAREGYWLSIEDADGAHYLHNVAASNVTDASGEMALLIAPMLRTPFADGAAVHLEKPMIEGFIDGNELEWTVDLALDVGIGFTIEEAA